MKVFSAEMAKDFEKPDIFQSEVVAVFKLLTEGKSCGPHLIPFVIIKAMEVVRIVL